MRVAVEFRHPSWHSEEVFALLARHQAGYCVMSAAGLPCELRATADFVYLRLHGPDRQHLYAGSYPEADLRWWADRIGEWDQTGHDVFAYFNNDGDTVSPRLDLPEPRARIPRRAGSQPPADPTAPPRMRLAPRQRVAAAHGNLI